MMGKPCEPGDALTKRQREVLDFIDGHIRLKRYAPTLREIGRAFGIKSTNGVRDHLILLAKKGAIQWVDGKSRTIVVTRGDFEGST